MADQTQTTSISARVSIQMMNASRQSLSLEQATESVISQTPAGRSESITLPDALHRIVYDDLNATADSPPFDKALMDGFAVDSAAVQTSHGRGRIELQVVETITAGNVPVHGLDDNTAARIMTGSQLPKRCDCVIPIEQVTFDEAAPQTVVIDASAIGPEQCLIRQGTAARSGEPLILRGTRLSPQQIAALAEFGLAEVAVAQQPTVAVLATGDELVEAHEQPGPGQIRNSNEPMLLAMARECGAAAHPLGIARDSVESLRPRIQSGLQHDILLLSGGVSAGMLDLVPSQLAEAGVQQVFHGVNLKPGRPLWFGYHNKPETQRRCLVFGLPGNPVSSLTCFQLFVRPAIQKLQGQDPGLPYHTAELQHDKSVRGSRPVWHPASLKIAGGRLTADLVAWSGSSDLRATVEANGMCELLPEQGDYATGSPVRCLFWNRPS